MVGLKAFFEGKFIGLGDAIGNLVDQHGPIRTCEIQRALSGQRDILNVTINMMLENNPTYIKIGKGTYDRIDRVIGNDQKVECCRVFLELQLIDSPKDVKFLQSRLHTIDINLEPRGVLSLIQRWENFNFDKRLVTLDQLSSDVGQYNAFYNDAKTMQSDKKIILAKLNDILPTSLKGMPAWDLRFTDNFESNDNKEMISPIVLSGFKVQIGLKSNG
jgi:hypothetical protein